MNPIDKALSDLRFKIPREVLEETFIRQPGFNNIGTRTPVSLDYRIRQEVIDARVIPDCNLVGGTEVTIPLKDVLPQYLPDHKVVYRIPMSLTQNRKISRVYSLVYHQGGAPTHSNLWNNGGSAYLDAASGLLATNSPIPQVSNAEVQLIGENTVLVNMHQPPSPSLHLRCVVEADSEFSHLKPGSIPRFSKLVEYAVKAYIYINLDIRMGRSYLSGGQDLGRFRDVVEGYADANELYETFFDEVWRKTSLFSDDQAHKRHLKMVTGGRH